MSAALDRAASLSPLIEHAYAAIARPEQWRDFLQSLIALHPGICAALVLRPLDAEDAPLVLREGYPAGAVEAFVEKHAASNPFNDLEREASIGSVYATLDHCPVESFSDTLFYTDWCVPFGLGAGFAVKLFHDADGYSTLVVDCSPALARQGRADIMRTLELVAPHVRRSVEVQRLIRKARRDAMADLVGTSIWPALVVDADGRLVLANEGARDMLSREELLVLRPAGGISLATEEGARRLYELLRQACAEQAAGPHPKRWLMPARPARGGLCVVEVMPLEARIGNVCTTTPYFQSQLQRCALVTLRMESALRLPSENDLQTAFGLTELEAHAVASLLNGQSINEQASLREVKSGSIRWHFRNIYHKLGSKTQAGLMTLVLSLVGR